MHAANFCCRSLIRMAIVSSRVALLHPRKSIYTSRRCMGVCVCVITHIMSVCVLHTHSGTHTQSHWPVGHTSLHSTWPTCSGTFCCESLSLSLPLFVLSVPFSAWFCSLATVLTIAIVNVCFVNGFDKFFCCNYST